MQADPADDDTANPVRWPWILGIWGALGLLDASRTVVGMRAMGMHHDWPALFLMLVIAWVPWALMTPVILGLGRRHPPSLAPRRPLATIAPHAAAVAFIAVASSAWNSALTWVLNPWNPNAPRRPFGDIFAGSLYENVLPALVLYAGVLMAGAVIDSRRRVERQRIESARLAEALALAQLSALRHQIEPHFLFNALNAVSGLVRGGENDRAVETIARVSDFLRHVLQESGAQEVPLEEELRFATMYLGIQQVRFADRLDVRLDVEPGLDRAIVPRLILQPIVENAVKHGISRRAQPGAIAIGAHRVDERLVLTVYNDGPSIAANDAPGDAAPGAHIGLANVRERLRGLHGDAAELAVDNVEARGVRVAITVPWREAACRA